MRADGHQRVGDHLDAGRQLWPKMLGHHRLNQAGFNQSKLVANAQARATAEGNIPEARALVLFTRGKTRRFKRLRVVPYVGLAVNGRVAEFSGKVLALLR